MNKEEFILKLANSFVDEYGKPLILAEGQKEIFGIILRRAPKRNIVMCATQYGKSLAVSLAVLIRAAVYAEKWAIVAPSERKAKIIMDYVIQHLFDSPLFSSQIEMIEPLERLKMERSKQRLTFKRGGEIFILSADTRNQQRAGESLLGFGAPNLILDESSLMDDKIHAVAKRMLGGHSDNFLMEIGNPFRRNHFLKTWQSDNYHKIKIDYKQAIQEDRFSPEFIEEMRKEAFFNILYECKFPEANEIDESGWSAILTDEEIKKATERKAESKGVKRLGVDVGRGGNRSVWVVRTDNYAYIKAQNRDPDLMSVVGKTITIVKEEGIKAENVFVDDVGVGGGVVDRLREQKYQIEGIKVGKRAQDSEKFTNLKAEAYWGLKNWILEGGILAEDEGWFQLCDVRYKEDSGSRLKIESKDDLRKRGVESLDVADALMLTFVKNIPSYIQWMKGKFSGDGASGNNQPSGLPSMSEMADIARNASPYNPHNTEFHF